MGESNPLGTYTGFKSNVNPTITNMFSHCAFRYAQFNNDGGDDDDNNYDDDGDDDGDDGDDDDVYENALLHISLLQIWWRF